MASPAGRAVPFAVLLEVPHLDHLVGRAGDHPPAIEIVSHVVDQVFVLRLNGACDVHAGWGEKHGGSWADKE